MRDTPQDMAGHEQYLANFAATYRPRLSDRILGRLLPEDRLLLLVKAFFLTSDRAHA